MAGNALFHDLRDELVAEVDAVMEETVQLYFLANGKSDPTRPNRTVEAPLRTGAEKTSSAAAGNGASWRMRIAAGKAELSIDMARYDGPQPQAGDKIRALDRPGQPYWQVANVDDRSHTRLVLELDQL